MLLYVLPEWSWGKTANGSFSKYSDKRVLRHLSHYKDFRLLKTKIIAKTKFISLIYFSY